eukprot:c4279_g1_i1.p1 GENE.c4279_g1_i1~~c4279_g1_i1.p1  ORF type:complete len:515 (+),score=108.45 c4279_g1_i1:37-1545(+)
MSDIASTTDDWTLMSADSPLDNDLMAMLFPTKDTRKREEWLAFILHEEFETVSDLAGLDEESWTKLGLPMAVKNKMQTFVRETMKRQSVLTTAEVAKVPDEVIPITQLDCIVLDISSSMKARSSIDPLKTREDMSKVLFHTMVDKLVGLELNHAVGLLAFGESMLPIPVTREYERFHDELGRMDARQHATKLYDSILEGAMMLLQFAKEHPELITPETKFRVFALTDGEDNASKQAAWQVTQYLQQNHIILDAFPLADHNPVLQSMATATSGHCLRVTSEEQGLALFEREAVLHVASRESQEPPPPITDLASLVALQNATVVVEDVKVAVPTQQLQAAVLSVTEVQSRAATSAGGAAVKRILKEYESFVANPASGWSASVSADDPHFWKATMMGPQSTPYEGGVWQLYVQFPNDYPFKPPKVRYLTPIYHCNINNDGGVCLDILKDAWSPALTINKIFLSLSSLLTDPNPHDALDAFKAQVLLTDKSRYEQEIKAHTAKYAM